MNVLIFYLLCVLFVSESLSIVPLVVHKISVRSTPSLDPAEELLEKFGNDNQMNLTQMEELFNSIGLYGWNDTATERTKKTGEQTCFSSQYFYGMYSKNDGNVNRTDLIDLCPAVLYQLSKKECQREKKEIKEDEDTEKEDPARAWGFGFLFVSIICLGSLLGAFVVPFMDKKIYQKILMFMVSLAVGVLSGSGIFHLIPSALGFPHGHDYSYLWKCAMIAAGMYLFFILESVMKLYIHFKANKKTTYAISVKPEESIENSCSDAELAKSNAYVINGHSHSHSHGGTELNNGHGHSHGGGFSSRGITDKAEESSGSEPHVITKQPEKKEIATVAWMIIMGDALHNFIDGLAIGASFSTSAVVGISTSLAVISEEIPHELGDFAILLNSGLTYKQAMAANFLSACTCYLGLVVGLVLGYATSAVKYIYGIAGGMFLYIALVDMLPEAVEMANALGSNSKSVKIKMMLLQNFAMVFGFCVMLILAYYASYIVV